MWILDNDKRGLVWKLEKDNYLDDRQEKREGLFVTYITTTLRTKR